MLLTRNQQAALQAANAHAQINGNGTGLQATPNNVSSSADLRSMTTVASQGSGAKQHEGDARVSQNLAPLEQHTSVDGTNDWVSTFAHSNNALVDDVFTAHNHHPGFDTSPATSSPFYRLPSSGAGPHHPQHHQAGQPSPTHFITDNVHSSQHQNHHQHRQHEQQQRTQASAEETFMATLHSHMAQLSPDKPFEEVVHQPRANVFVTPAYNASPAANNNRQRSDSALAPAFSTPAPIARTMHAHHDHARTYSMDSIESNVTGARGAMQRHDLMPQQRIPGSAESSMSMNMDHVDMLGTVPLQSESPLNHSLGGSMAGSRMRNVDRQNRSLGQVSAAMNGDEDGLLRLGGPMKPIDASTYERFALSQQHHQSQHQTQNSTSARSMSPPEHLPLSHHQHQASSGFMGNFSPQSSSFSTRHAGDSSIDTSTDSISNSATTMSAVPSQASSISGDFLSKKLPKVKTRLRNIDRKAICEAARDDPKVRQEDLALRFGIERSTVSKTLKNREKWLKIEDDGHGAMIVKHRTGKFPQLEERLAKWIHDEVGVETPMLDMTIKQRALLVAAELDIGMDQFKASVGWIDKFRERHKLPKVQPATPLSADIDSGSADLASGDSDEAQQRAQAFRSGLTLAAAEQSGGSTNDEIDMFYSTTPSNSSQMDLAPNVSTPNRQRSGSSEMAIGGVQETPKAAKRHYDDMMLSDVRAGGSIDTDMARMHLPTVAGAAHSQRGRSDAGYDGSNGSGFDGASGNGHHHDDSGYAAGASSNTPSSSTSTGASKRRKAASNASNTSKESSNLEISVMQQHQQSPNDAATMATLREQLRRTRGDQMFLAQGRSDGAGIARQSSVAIAAVAAAEEIRRNEEARSHQQQPPRGSRLQRMATDNMNLMRGLQRSLSGPTSGSMGQQQQDATMREIGVGGNGRHSHTDSGEASPTVFIGTPPPRHDLMGILQSTGTSPISSAMSTSNTVGTALSGSVSEERQVTLDEARESLDVVLAFIARQPANLSPSEYFVLGNLQGQLSALANHGQAPMSASGVAMHSHEQQQQVAMQQQSQNQSQEQLHEQAQQHAGLNMLGITGGNVTLAGDVGHHPS